MALSASLILALAAVAVQAHPQNFDFSAIQNANCPDGWSANGMNGGSTLVYCCPGAGYFNNGEQGCIVGASTVLADNPSYTAIVSSLYAGEQGGSAPNTADATATDDVSMMPEETGEASASITDASVSTASTTAESASGAAGSSASPTAESTSSQAGAPALVTAAPLLGAAALALFAL